MVYALFQDRETQVRYIRKKAPDAKAGAMVSQSVYADSQPSSVAQLLRREGGSRINRRAGAHSWALISITITGFRRKLEHRCFLTFPQISQEHHSAHRETPTHHDECMDFPCRFVERWLSCD